MSSFFGSPTPESASGDPVEEIPTTTPPSETSASPDASASLNLELFKLLAAMQQQQQNKTVQTELQKPPTPIMGGLVLSNKTWEPWVGGKPNFDWSGLVDEAPRVPLPTQLRPLGSKAASSMIKRSESIFDDTKSKFKTKDDLDFFCRGLHQFFKTHGLDTVTYRTDPQDSTNMVSILTHYSCLSRATVNKQTAWMKNKYDAYDLQNDNSAKQSFLNSLQDALKKDIQIKTKPDDLFVDVFVVFIENERPVSHDLFQSMERKVLALHISQFAGANVKLMASAARETIQELVRARMWDSLKNSSLCRIFAVASPGNAEYSNPMYSLLNKVKTESMEIIHLTNVQKLQHMIDNKVSHDNILDTATDLYNEQTIDGLIRWPALINVRDKSPIANLSQMQDRGNGNSWKFVKKRKSSFKNRNSNWKNGGSGKGNFNPRKSKDRELKHTPPSTTDKPSKTVNGQPVFVKELFGRHHEWCAKCKRWTTTHNTATHIGRSDKNKFKSESGEGVCTPASGSTPTTMTSSTHFANQASSYLIPADPRIHLAMLTEQTPNTTSTSKSDDNTTSGGDGDGDGVGDNIDTVIEIFRHFAVLFLMWKIITSVCKTLWNHFHDFAPYFAPLLSHVVAHLLAVPLSDYIKLGWRLGLNPPQTAELPLKPSKPTTTELPEKLNLPALRRLIHHELHMLIPTVLKPDPSPALFFSSRPFGGEGCCTENNGTATWSSNVNI